MTAPGVPALTGFSSVDRPLIDSLTLKIRPPAYMNMKAAFHCASLAVASSLSAQTLILNGSLEQWGALTGTPPSGTPTSWGVASSTSKPVQIAGLVAESTYAAYVLNGSNNTLQQNTSAQPLAFQLDFVLAATDPGSASARSFNMTIGQNTVTNPSINLRTVRGSEAGKLTLQAFNGSAWTTVAADAFSASVYSAGSFTTLNAYNVSLAVDYGTASYSISYGLVGEGSVSVTGLTAFQTAVVLGEGIKNISFLGSSSSSGFAVDNVSVTAIPEPSSVAGLAGFSALGVALFAARRFRTD